MPDPRFFHRAAALTLDTIAKATGAALKNANPKTLMEDVASLDVATASHISFLDNVKYVDAFAESKAGACFVREKFTSRAPAAMALLITDDPYSAYAQTAQLFYPLPASAGISPHAHIDPSATIGSNAQIDAGAYIGAGVVIGDNTRIGANSTITHALIGNNVIIHRGVHIGQDGFGFAPSKTGIIKVPQLGRVIIEDDVEIGSGTCIDRGAVPDTIIGRGSKIDNLVQIGHNVKIGKFVVIAGQAGIAGSSVIEDGAMIGGQVGLSGHVTIGKGAKLAAQAGIMTHIPPGSTYGGSPAVPIKDWHRQTATLAKLAERGKKE